MVRLRVEKVGVDANTGLAVVLLYDVNEARVLPIWIGALEASSVALALEEIKPPRPMTHDLLYNILLHLDGNVVAATISDLRDGTFFAKMTVQIGSEQVEFDSRPSDAIALALRFRASIYATDEVMELAAIPPDDVGSDGTEPLVH
ncbi:MAG TPA: bifunctional nuclease family protein [Firmicutes bacterium]|jgi:bifunctional DNase/RNase|nr:bifunctional nuclease family protein [Bacillota bacterium]